MPEGCALTLNVLVLEGNQVTRTLLSRVIQDSFSDTVQVVAVSGLAAAQQAMDHNARAAPDNGDGPFKLIVIDLELPEAGTLGWLRSLADHTAIKVVTTLHSDDDHLFPAIQGGADGYLLKEDRFETLVEILQKIVRGQVPLSPALARRTLTHFKQRESVSSDPTSPDGLTGDERELLTHMSKGFTGKEIANMMGLKASVVNDHVKRIYKKLDDANPTPGASHG